MSEHEVLTILEQAAGNSPFALQTLSDIREAYASQPDLTLNDILYWLDERAYYILTWKQKHLQEGQADKAAQEGEEALILQKMIDALHGNPYKS